MNHVVYPCKFSQLGLDFLPPLFPLRQPNSMEQNNPRHVQVDGVDPFIVDDTEDSLSETDGPQSTSEPPPLDRLSSTESQANIRDEVPLSSPSQSTPIAAYPSPQARRESFRNTPPLKQSIILPPVPPKDEIPALYLPGLISSSHFLPLPNTDPLSVLLNKYVEPEIRPARDLSGTWSHTDFHTLVMTNSWRALARMARDRIVAAKPDDLALILELWFLRLSALARLRLFNQTSSECQNLFSILSNVQPELVRNYLFESILPFELEVMRARTKYWGGDPYGYLDELMILLNKCKKKARGSSAATDVEMWKERAVRVGLIIASQLLEMKDNTAAANLLLPLCQPQPDGTLPSPPLLSAVARLYLDTGDIDSAEVLFQRAEADPSCDDTTKEMNQALLAIARLDWTAAETELRSILDREPENPIAANNLSVALLGIGKLQEGIHWLEEAFRISPSTVGNVEPFLFNLATLYELRTATSHDKKKSLLVEVAKWAGDGLRANCLKLPTT
ncbi:hypothetical protein FRC03_011449 [Tulasnella sp. 419]|nr:hypothetical protein FRC03_011449 [Tulasnella sp. 419]